jgi:transcriptional regulator with XRE-family HTH domain
MMLCFITMMQESAIDVAMFLHLVGRRVAGARERRGVSQAQLALAARLSKAMIAGLERGEHGVEVDQLRRVADALGVDTRELLPEYDDVARPSE